VREREDEWTGLMRSAISGDDAAYQRLLKAITPVLRAAARRGLARAGQPVDQSEDIVQDILLAVHLKRHTWDANAPFAPWLFAIARNKLIDSLRRRGRRVFVNIDDFAETIASEPATETAPASEVAAQLQSLPARQRDVLQSIAVDSASIKDKGSNAIGWDNKESDRLLETARTTLDPVKRTELWHEWEKLIVDEQPYTFLWARYDRMFVNGRFQNTDPYKLDIVPYDWFVPAALQKYH